MARFNLSTSQEFDRFDGIYEDSQNEKGVQMLKYTAMRRFSSQGI